MHFPTALPALALLAASATAMPTTDARTSGNLEKRGLVTSVKFYTNDGCKDIFNSMAVYETKLSGCVAMPQSARSIMYHNHNGY